MFGQEKKSTSYHYQQTMPKTSFQKTNLNVFEKTLKISRGPYVISKKLWISKSERLDLNKSPATYGHTHGGKTLKPFESHFPFI